MSWFCIPHALQIDLDDAGWFVGQDERSTGGPSRTGIGRRHVPLDYAAIEELGRRLDMKINTALVLGEWDPDNRLKGIKHLSKHGENWNNAAFYDTRVALECAEILKNAKYINLTLHGLLHGYYMPGTDNHDASDYYYRVNKELFMVPEEEIRERIRAFFDLLRYHGIDAKIDTMIPPSFAYRWNELSRVVGEFGIKYVGTIYKTMNKENAPEDLEWVGIEDTGVITYDRHSNPIPWNALGYDFDTLAPLKGLVGLHWPNILSEDPERNTETVECAERYFKRCACEFDTVLSRDVKYYVTQEIARRYVGVRESENEIVLTLDGMPRHDHTGKSFTVRSERRIASIVGAAVRETPDHSEFLTYEITPVGTDEIRLTFE